MSMGGAEWVTALRGRIQTSRFARRGAKRAGVMMRACVCRMSGLRRRGGRQRNPHARARSLAAMMSFARSMICALKMTMARRGG